MGKLSPARIAARRRSVTSSLVAAMLWRVAPELRELVRDRVKLFDDVELAFVARLQRPGAGAGGCRVAAMLGGVRVGRRRLQHRRRVRLPAAGAVVGGVSAVSALYRCRRCGAPLLPNRDHVGVRLPPSDVECPATCAGTFRHPPHVGDCDRCELEDEDDVGHDDVRVAITYRQR